MTFLMRRYIYAILLTASSAAAAKYVFVDVKLTWPDAQEYCRTHFTELAPLSSSQDMDEIHRAVDGSRVLYSWVGLYRREADEAGWRWSGGGHASYLPWARQEPNSWGLKAALCLSCLTNSYRLYAWTQYGLSSFFCLNLVVVVTERRTWEAALEYCRERHDDLASLASETELLLASREIREAQTGERVWVGLRHFRARWLWLRGEPLGNNASLQMGLQGCPTCDPSLDPPRAGQTQQCYTCGSLSHGGELQGLDCMTELHFLCY